MEMKGVKKDFLSLSSGNYFVDEPETLVDFVQKSMLAGKLPIP